MGDMGDVGVGVVRGLWSASGWWLEASIRVSVRGVSPRSMCASSLASSVSLRRVRRSLLHRSIGRVRGLTVRARRPRLPVGLHPRRVPLRVTRSAIPTRRAVSMTCPLLEMLYATGCCRRRRRVRSPLLRWRHPQRSTTCWGSPRAAGRSRRFATMPARRRPPPNTILTGSQGGANPKMPTPPMLSCSWPRPSGATEPGTTPRRHSRVPEHTRCSSSTHQRYAEDTPSPMSAAAARRSKTSEQNASTTTTSRPTEAGPTGPAAPTADATSTPTQPTLTPGTDRSGGAAPQPSTTTATSVISPERIRNARTTGASSRSETIT